MKALLLALALLTGCYFHARPVEFDYGDCFVTAFPIAACETYYEWIPGWVTLDGTRIDGYYRLRSGYTVHYRDHRLHVRHR